MGFALLFVFSSSISVFWIACHSNEKPKQKITHLSRGGAMDRKLIAVLFLIVGAVFYFAFVRGSSLSPVQQVFINETSDHRFDESIQVSILSAYNRTQVQNAVLITDNIPSAEFENAALKMFETLHLGRETKGRAILYLYSPKNKALKIEVGYALESVLPDVVVHGLEKAAKSFIFSDHYQDFWAELINTLNIEIYEQEHGKRAGESFDFSKLKFVSGGAGVVSRLYDATPEQLAREMSQVPPDKHSRFLPNPDVKISLQNYLASLREGIGDDTLPLLSFESRVFRELTPMTTYQLFRNWRMYDSAGVDQIVTEDDFSFVFFKSGHPVLPLVFQKLKGVWQVQEPLSWSLFQRFEDSMQVFLKFPLRLRTTEGNAYLQKNFARPLYREPTLDFQKLPNEQQSYFYFRLYWLDRVAKTFESQALDKMTKEQLWIKLDTMNNLGRFSEFLKVMTEIVKRYPDDKTLARNFAFYQRMFVFSGPQWRLSL
jgi:hypothetical protein